MAFTDDPLKRTSRAVERMRSTLMPNQVGLVMRWNERSDLVWSVFSEATAQDDRNIPVKERSAYIRRNGDGGGDVEICTESTAPFRPFGMHAEELMLCNWQWFERDAAELDELQFLGRAEPAPWLVPQPLPPAFTLSTVDIILSKSPCYGPGGSQAMQVGGVDYGTSCAMKLRKFFSDRPLITWRLFYLAIPPEKNDGVSRFLSKSAPKSERTRDVLAWKKSEEIRTRDLGRRFPDFTGDSEGEEDATFDSLAKSLKASLERRTTTLGVPGSFVSGVKLAYEGIAKLNAVPNVECQPYHLR